MSRKRRNSRVHSEGHKELVQVRSQLMERAKQGDREAQKVLAAPPYWIKVWTSGQIDAYESSGLA